MKKFLVKDKYIEQTEDKMDAGDTYKKNYNGKTGAKISRENGAGIPIPPKTISEAEEMEEFQEIKNIICRLFLWLD